MQDPQPLKLMTRRRVPRRQVLQAGGLAAGSVVAAGTALPVQALAAGVPAEHVSEYLALFAQATPMASPMASPEAYTPVALTEAEFTTLRAVVGRIIPADELGPGADEAGVQVFIDLGLAGPNAATLPLYQGVLAALDAAAGGDGFAAATAEDQDALLTELEAGELADAPEGVFGLLLEHTRQGMFGDPIYGGNQNFAGWDLIGYPGIKLVWTEAEQEIDAAIEPEHVSVEEYGGTGW